MGNVYDRRNLRRLERALNRAIDRGDPSAANALFDERAAALRARPRGRGGAAARMEAAARALAGVPTGPFDYVITPEVIAEMYRTPPPAPPSRDDFAPPPVLRIAARRVRGAGRAPRRARRARVVSGVARAGPDGDGPGDPAPLAAAVAHGALLARDGARNPAGAVLP
jgi:hypothetical protein